MNYANYAFEKVGDCLGQHHAGGVGTVSPLEEISPWDLVVVKPHADTLIAQELLSGGGGLDGLGKICLGRANDTVRLATLNWPMSIDVPISEIQALHKVDGGLGLEELTIFERGAVVYLSQYNTQKPIAAINPEWRPHGTVGLSAITGEMATRYASRTGIGAMAGPSFELLESLSLLPGIAATGQWIASDTRKLRKLIPYQNLFYLRRLLDEVERNTNDVFGIPRSRSVTRR